MLENKIPQNKEKLIIPAYIQHIFLKNDSLPLDCDKSIHVREGLYAIQFELFKKI